MTDTRSRNGIGIVKSEDLTSLSLDIVLVHGLEKNRKLPTVSEGRKSDSAAVWPWSLGDFVVPGADGLMSALSSVRERP